MQLWKFSRNFVFLAIFVILGGDIGHTLHGRDMTFGTFVAMPQMNNF